MKTSKTQRRNAVLSVAVVLIIMAGAANAATTFFLSDKAVGEGPVLSNPVWNLQPGQFATIHIYCQADQKLSAVGIDLASTDPAVAEGTAAVVHNPNFDLFGNPVFNTDRWQGASDGTLGDLADDLRAVTVTSGTGLEADPSLAMWDPGYDQTAQAYLYATVDVIATGEIGSSIDLFMMVDSMFIAPAVGTAADVDVIFGAGETVPLNGESVGIPSAIADGTINIVPEPVSLLLLSVGALALIRRKTE